MGGSFLLSGVVFGLSALDARDAYNAAPSQAGYDHAGALATWTDVTLIAGCVFAAGPVQGKTLLITGGAGAVGHYAVQLAAWAGAEAIATVSSIDKANRARQGGARPSSLRHRASGLCDSDARARIAGVRRVVDARRP